MKEILKGRCWVFGNNVDTDQIIQGRYLTLLDYSEMSKHAFEGLKPEFVTKMRLGDIVVAGRNFGGGSSREEAPMVLKELGVACVVAESFARIFFRNGFNIGLPLVVVPRVLSKVSEGDALEINLGMGTVKTESGEVLEGNKLPQLMLDILRAGGAVSWYKANL